jgi:hypothetical protein
MKRAAALFAAVWLAFAPVPTAASDLARMAPIIDVQGLIEGDVTLAGGQISIEAEIAGGVSDERLAVLKSALFNARLDVVVVSVFLTLVALITLSCVCVLPLMSIRST